QRDALGRTSVGYVGTSDAWQDFDRNGAMTWSHRRAGPGNVAMAAELQRRCVLAVGFGQMKESAGTLALTALAQPFESPWLRQIKDWRSWHGLCDAGCGRPERLPAAVNAAFRTSAMVLRVHQDKIYAGAMVASL